MKTILAKTAGFCFGVSRAVELVEQAAAAGKQVVTLGPIIHNRHVVGKFEAMGIGVVNAPEAATQGSTVIIRSHGVSRAVVEQLEKQGVEIIDATCPFVKRIHGIVSRAEEEGRIPVIIGTPTHPEVEAFVMENYRYQYRCGYRLFKIDYVSAMLKVKVFHDPSATPYGVLNTLMQKIQEATGPDAVLLGCSLPPECGA